MDSFAAEKELAYRLTKIMLYNLVRDGILHQEYAENLRKEVRDTLSPVVGCLEDEVSYDE